MQSSSRVQESAHSEGAVSKALQAQPDEFVQEYVEKRLVATQNIARSIGQTAQDGSLSPVEAARTIAKTIGEVWGLSEFEGLYSPGASFGDLLMGGRSPQLAANR